MSIRTILVVALGLLVSLSVQAEVRNLAPGFSGTQPGEKILLMAPDIELFSISGGGVVEPKADWTDLAQRYVHNALLQQVASLDLKTESLSESQGDAFAEISALNAAVSRAIAFHHFGASNLQLPTKNQQLDWSMGDAVQPLREATGADYALFIWVRDSYASAERKAAMIALAMLGVGVVGGVQTGYASLVDLRTGQFLWFNRLFRTSGDLREEGPAGETLKLLLTNFPAKAK